MPPLGKKASVFPARSQGVFGCENCREQHLKCDRVTPICGRCQNAGRECRRTGLRVRETKAKYSKSQKWVKTPKRIIFIHETNVANETEGLSPDSGPEDYLEVDLPGSPETLRDGPSRRSSLQSPIKSCSMTPVPPRFPRDIFAPPKVHPAYEETLKTPSPYLTQDQQPTKLKGSSEDSEGRSVKEKSGSPSDRFLRQPIYVDHSILPLTELQQARLIRHFVQKLAIWLDLCDPNLSFQTVVPQRARRCSILLNSILALAGRHLAHVDKAFPPDVYRTYSSDCIKRLCDWGGNEDLQEHEDVFAATVILRVMAELEATDNGGQLECHFLSGLHLCVQNQRTMLRNGSLGAAAYWVGLRQEIYNAVANQEQVSMLKMDVLPDIIKNSLSRTDDYTWANRAVAHCAEVLNYCFGPPHEKLRERWNDLMRWNRDWTLGTATTFSPIYEAPDNVPFPEIWYTQSCHVIGTQHHLLAQLFLEHCHPDMPAFGVPHEQAKENRKPKLQKIVRKICGIGLGNSWTPPSMFTACMAIHAFGSLFTDRIDQQQMIDILHRTEQEHGRPTSQVQREMVNTVWRWDITPSYLVKQEFVKNDSPIRAR